MEKTSIFLVLIWFFNEVSLRDPAAEQLTDLKNTLGNVSLIQTSFGAPVSNIAATLRVGLRGPILLQDKVFLDVLAHFDRERIPERVVHAKGAGAFGYFEVTKDIKNYTKAVVFNEVGKMTKIAVRFSLVVPEKGSADTVRNPRGFAIKFYSEEGIWDLVGLSFPVFFIRDPIEFPNFIHAMKRNPATGLHDTDMSWDFLLGRPESIYATLIQFTDLGTPDGYRHMDGYGINTFKMVNASEEAFYIKFHLKTQQGIRNLTLSEATSLAGSDPDHSARDLYNSIALNRPPSWILYIQIMTFEQAKNLPWNPFDPTKIWPENAYPLIEAGKLVLNENPKNIFAEIEQLAFDPGNLISGIEVSPDILLQGRLFSYSDSERYRLGVNYLQLPVNCPFANQKVTNYERDGKATMYNQDGAPNYYPNSFGGPQNDPKVASSVFYVAGDVERYNTSDEDNYSQPSQYWNSLSDVQKESLISNLASDLKNAAPFLQEKAINIFSLVNKELGESLGNLLQNN